MNKVELYIESNWDKCVRENTNDNGTLIGLPYPYVVPSTEAFNELYYWDTYFTNKGLELSGRAHLAKSNTDNIIFLVEKYGYMPNGNRTWFLGKSQPPFLSEMVKDVFEYYRDIDWLKNAYKALEKEYRFWMTKRITGTGLNKYSVDEKDRDHYEDFIARIKYRPDGDRTEIENHYLSTCESGWDCSPRFGFRIYDYVPVDLNSLMYLFEKNMSCFSQILNNGQHAYWEEAAAKRKALMKKYMKNKDGIWLDYNYKTGKHSEVFSIASYYPMFADMLDENEVSPLVESLYMLEAEYGYLTCGKHTLPGNFQWDAPNGWACLQYILIKSMHSYGYFDIAKKVACKYKNLVEKVFEETGALWEKYNVIEGNVNVKTESRKHMPSMMGWSAGTYLYACEYLKSFHK